MLRRNDGGSLGSAPGSVKATERIARPEGQSARFSRPRASRDRPAADLCTPQTAQAP
jgi:hypothetical protein